MDVSLTDIDKFNHWHDTDFPALPEYKLKIRTFANGAVDFIMQKTKFTFMREAFTGFQETHQRDLSAEELERKQAENLERACRRAKQSVQFAIRQINADHMLTLTTRENITDTKQFDAFFTKFIRLVRGTDYVNGALVKREVARQWSYVGVRELQERGAIHMHIACCGKQDIFLLRACWYVALGGFVSDKGDSTKGAVHVRYREKRFSGISDAFKNAQLVGYLTKYISKSFADNEQLGFRRYKTSRGIPKPNVQKQYLPVFMSGNSETDFINGVVAVSKIAEFLGARDFEPWNRGLDIYILRANLGDI